MGHHVHVDLPGVLHDRRADSLVEDPRPARPARRTDHQLGGIHLTGEVQQRFWQVITDYRVYGGAEAGGQLPNLAHLWCGNPGEAVAAHHVHDHQLGAGLRRDAGCPAHQGLGLGPAGDRDDHAFAGLPGGRYLVVGAVLRQGGVDLVGEPQQGQLPQRGEVAAAEVVRQRRVDLLGGVDVAVGKPAPQGLRCDVDQFDLGCLADDLVGHRLLLFDAGDLRDDVVEALEVLHVDGGDHRDAGVEQLFDVHPAFRVLAARGVGVGQFVDEDDLRPPGQYGRYVEFGETAAAVVDVARRDDVYPVEQLGGLLAAVGLDHRGDQVRAALEAAVRLAEHCEGLADTRRRTEVDAQLAPLRLGAGRGGLLIALRRRVRRRFAAGSHAWGLDGVHASIIRRSIHRSISSSSDTSGPRRC